MKHLNLLLIGLVCGLFTTAYSTTYHIVNNGTTFSPNVVTAMVGDTVVFALGSNHNMVEVSETSWNANDSVYNGGYRLGFSGGKIILTSIDTIFFVCAPHAHLGMKGKIFVTAFTPLHEVVNNTDILLNVFPNPVIDQLTVSFYVPRNTAVNIDLLDISGKVVKHLLSGEFPVGSNTETINVNDLNPGLYFVKYNVGNQSSNVRVLKP
jgi:plastocyanin